ncbi:MAG: AAA family ATPase [Bacteroidetes bacterium]|nr:AAA family ATPase [Bacteroidota bacterium]MBU1719839.1 AAA family ATPase [Bacteroidota bacterium]
MKTIVLLIGLKGSGKSLIGSLIEKNHHAKFVRVEDCAKGIKKERAVTDESYIREAFAAIETGIRISLNTNDAIVFESTGLTVYFDRMLDSLKRDFRVIIINVYADPETCLTRVRTRCESIHINVSDNEVNEINSAVAQKNSAADFEIDNSTRSIKELSVEIDAIMRKIGLYS